MSRPVIAGMSGPYLVLPVVLCLVEKNGIVLAGKRAHRPYRDHWDLPGGRVEPGERLDDAVKRELREETGLSAKVVHLKGAYHYPGNEGSPAIFLLYRVEEEGMVTLTEELPLLRWFNSQEMETLELTPWSRHFLHLIGDADTKFNEKLKR